MEKCEGERKKKIGPERGVAIYIISEDMGGTVKKEKKMKVKKKILGECWKINCEREAWG